MTDQEKAFRWITFAEKHLPIMIYRMSGTTGYELACSFTDCLKKRLLRQCALNIFDASEISGTTTPMWLSLNKIVSGFQIQGLDFLRNISPYTNRMGPDQLLIDESETDNVRAIVRIYIPLLTFRVLNQYRHDPAYPIRKIPQES